MKARLYSPAKTAMSSGMARSKGWVLEFEPEHRANLDPLMGWAGSDDTQKQVRLRFKTRKAAQQYADHHGITVTIETPTRRKPNIRPGGYGENFSPNRRKAWTH